MFGFLRGRKAPAPAPQAIPPLHPDNPGEGSLLVLRAQGGEAPDLRFDMVELLRHALSEEDVPARREGDALILDDGLILQPRFLEMEGANGRVRTATTVQANHPRLYPQGMFEFQHAMGTTPEESLLNGFRSWTTMDRVALSGALEEKPANCLVMLIPLEDGRHRRAVIGPFSHYMSEPPAAGTPAAEEAEKFCPCCLFSNSLETLMPLLARPDTLGLRLFASMSGGEAQADCRANGLDHPEGADALRHYAAGWLPKGEMEFRKQYLIVHDVPAP